MRPALLTTLFLLTMLTSCAINPNVQELSSRPPRVRAEMPRVNHAHATTRPPREYHLGFGDVVEIKFFNNSEYNDVVAVRPDGKITLQRLGDIDVAGMHVSRLDSIITTNYSEILVDPEVTVIVREFGGQFVYVMGEVLNPGSYDITKGMSLLRAIAAAGGPLHSAKMNSVVLLRANEQKNISAERFDLLPSSIEVILDNDVQVQPYDIVYVPKTFIADLESFVTRIYKIVIPPLDLATRYRYYNTIR